MSPASYRTAPPRGDSYNYTDLGEPSQIKNIICGKKRTNLKLIHFISLIARYVFMLYSNNINRIYLVEIMKKYLCKLLTSLFLILMVIGGAAANAKELVVVTSIKPIHSLVSRVMGNTGKPELLVQGGVTPHIFRMKPSDFRKVANADVLFYISPKFETFLKSTAKNKSLNAIAFATQEDIKLHPYRTSKIWFAEGDSHDELRVRAGSTAYAYNPPSFPSRWRISGSALRGLPVSFSHSAADL